MSRLLRNASIGLAIAALTCLPAGSQVVSNPTPPAGANTQMQYNNNGIFGGSANFTFNPSVSAAQGAGSSLGNNASINAIALPNAGHGTVGTTLLLQDQYTGDLSVYNPVGLADLSLASTFRNTGASAAVAGLYVATDMPSNSTGPIAGLWGIYNAPEYDGSGNVTGTFYGLYNQVSDFGTGTTTNLFGVKTAVFAEAVGTYTLVVGEGVEGFIGGPATEADGFLTRITAGNSWTATNVYAYKIDTNFCARVTGNCFGFDQEGTGTNHLQGGVELGKVSATTGTLKFFTSGSANTLTLQSASIATSSRTVTFPDPGGADTAVYLTLAQTLANKTLTTPNIGVATQTALVAGGSTPTLTGTCTTGTQVGGNTTGTFLATCTAQTVIITFATTAPHGWVCSASDWTTVADTLKQTTDSATSCTLSGTTVASDKIGFQAFAY